MSPFFSFFPPFPSPLDVFLSRFVTTDDNNPRGRNDQQAGSINSISENRINVQEYDGNERTDGQQGLEQVGHVASKGRHPFSAALNPIKSLWLTAPTTSHPGTPARPSSTSFNGEGNNDLICKFVSRKAEPPVNPPLKIQSSVKHSVDPGMSILTPTSGQVKSGFKNLIWNSASFHCCFLRSFNSLENK